jgi:hypothetical protein
MAQTKVRHDCYQNGNHYVITVYCPCRTKNDIVTEYQNQKVVATVIDANGNPYTLDYDLLNEIVPEGCYEEITAKKVEIYLEKKEKNKTWVALKYDPEIIIKSIDRAGDDDLNKVNKNAYPSSYAKKNGINWATNIVQEEEVNKDKIDQMDHYRQFYQDSTEEQRMVMNRAYVESGGQTLIIQGSELDLDERQKDITKALDNIGQIHYNNTDENKKIISTFVNQYFETLFTNPSQIKPVDSKDLFGESINKVVDTFNTYSDSGKKEATKLIKRHIKMMFKRKRRN